MLNARFTEMSIMHQTQDGYDAIAAALRKQRKLTLACAFQFCMRHVRRSGIHVPTVTPVRLD
jgi:hypothetical protein